MLFSFINVVLSPKELSSNVLLKNMRASELSEENGLLSFRDKFMYQKKKNTEKVFLHGVKLCVFI